MATTLSVGELSCNALVGAKQEPPPGHLDLQRIYAVPNRLIDRARCHRARGTDAAVERKAIPKRCLEVRGAMSRASGCSVSTASIPISMKSGNAQLLEPQECMRTAMSKDFARSTNLWRRGRMCLRNNSVPIMGPICVPDPREPVPWT